MTTPIKDSTIINRLSMSHMYIKSALDHINIDKDNPTYNNLSHIDTVIGSLETSINILNDLKDELESNKDKYKGE
jgi:hypothetical protein